MPHPNQRRKPSRSPSPWSTGKLAFTKENQEKLKAGRGRASVHPRSQHRSEQPRSSSKMGSTLAMGY